METFSATKQLAKVIAGFKGGPFFKNPIRPAPMSFANGIDPLVAAKLGHQSIPTGTPSDPWGGRKGK